MLRTDFFPRHLSPLEIIFVHYVRLVISSNLKSKLNGKPFNGTII